MNDEIFSITLKVRDYECDMQGIVNNAIYLNYLEHARHEYLSSLGLSFNALIEQGIYAVVMRSEQIYKRSLCAGQTFKVTCQFLPESKFKLRCIQEIYNEQNELVLTATLLIASIDKYKKPIPIESFIPL